MLFRAGNPPSHRQADPNPASPANPNHWTWFSSSDSRDIVVSSFGVLTKTKASYPPFSLSRMPTDEQQTLRVALFLSRVNVLSTETRWGTPSRYFMIRSTRVDIPFKDFFVAFFLWPIAMEVDTPYHFLFRGHETSLSRQNPIQRASTGGNIGVAGSHACCR